MARQGSVVSFATLHPLSALVLVVGLGGGLVLIGLLAVTAQRLLGLRVGLGRTFIAGAIGYATAALVSAAIRPAGHGHERAATSPALIPLLIGVCVLVTMALLIAAEAAVPSGAGTRPIRELRRRLRRARRYAQVTAIAARHGLGPLIRGRGSLSAAMGPEGARSVRRALTDGGVAFVKLGQLLSTRRDLLSDDLVDELGRLQSDAEPAPSPAVRAVLEAELGAPPEEVFASFDVVPLAAASVAQVHGATLRSGEEVVVKVQRPGIGRVVERDLDIVVSLAAAMEARAQRGTSTLGTIQGAPPGLNVLELARGFADALSEELDFRVEARNVSDVRAGVAGDRDGAVRVPAVHHELSTARVLVLERLRGVPLGVADAEIIARGLDRSALATTLLRCFVVQMLVDGVFHADPHPGNVLLLDDGRLGLLDLGSVGRLDAALREALTALLLAIERSDAGAAADALLELGRRPDELDERALERDLGRFMARHLSAGAVPTPEMFTDLFRMLARHRLVVAPEVAAVFRAMATLEGTLTQLSPGFDLVGGARSVANELAAARLRPRAAMGSVADELTALAPILRRLPRRVDRLGGALQEGRLGFGVRLFADERDRRVVTSLVHQTLLAFLAATIGMMGTVLLIAGGGRAGPRISGGPHLFALFGCTLLVISFVLILRVLLIVFRPER